MSQGIQPMTKGWSGKKAAEQEAESGSVIYYIILGDLDWKNPGPGWVGFGVVSAVLVC